MTTPKSLRGWLVTLALTTGVNCGGSDATAFSRGQGGKTGDASAAGGSEAGGSSGSSTGGAATGGSSTGSGGTSGGSGGRSSGDGGAVDGGGTGGGSDVGDASPTGDSAAEAGTCSNPTTFFADTDDDKFGDPLTTIKACGKPPGYVENSDDCYDDNASAKPGQTGWFKVDRGDGSYDYDCDKSEAQHWAVAGSCGTIAFCQLTEGWEVTVPPCGTDGRWITACSPIAICAVFQTTPRTQECH